MNITIVNESNSAVPIASANEGGWAEELMPNEQFEVDRAETDVIVIGDKPDFLDEIKDTYGAFVDFVTDLVHHWHKRHEVNAGEQPAAAPPVIVHVQNNGERGIRVLAGANTNESELSPGQSTTVEAAGYVELRELSGEAPATEDQSG